MIRLPMLAPLAAVLLLTALAHDAEAGARRSRPLETGQTTCWDNDGMVIVCGGLQDGALRRGEPRAYRDDGETVRDLRTALTWEKLSDDDSIHDKDNSYTWGFAFAKIEDLNIACFGGFCDWRVPNRFELETLLNMEFIGPAVSSPFDTACATDCALPTCSCTGLAAHWTSTSYADDPDTAWVIEFYAGQAFTSTKTNTFRVRAVRGGAS
jgi:Protein of unknown function (DUF1566)